MPWKSTIAEVGQDQVGFAAGVARRLLRGGTAPAGAALRRRGGRNSARSPSVSTHASATARAGRDHNMSNIALLLIRISR